MSNSRNPSQMPAEVESALRAQTPSGEQIVWLGRPSISHAVERAARVGWQRAAILGGGYSVLLGVGATWFTGQMAWLALPVVWLTACCFGLRSDYLRTRRLRESLAHTAYALTIQHALVVQTRPTLQANVVPLSDVEPLCQPSADPHIGDLLFKRTAGRLAIVFSDVLDPRGVRQFIDQLKTTPKAMEEQFQLAARWAELRDELG